jgi:hypothetical protein
MKLSGRRTGDSRYDDFPFIQERVACKINAMIEVLELPAEKLQLATTEAITHKLLELSDDKESWQTPTAQLAWLEYVIKKICDDDMIKKVMNLTQEKFDSYMKTPELI